MSRTHAIDEMLDLGLQCFLRGDVRRPHVTGSISDSELMGILGRPAEGNALVVDFDLLARLKIVVDNHLLAATDKGLTDLDGESQLTLT